ncbi:MAG: hypothetical protein R3C59_16780 [Planctomycetaceae bacterium]
MPAVTNPLKTGVLAALVLSSTSVFAGGHCGGGSCYSRIPAHSDGHKASCGYAAVSCRSAIDPGDVRPVQSEFCSAHLGCEVVIRPIPLYRGGVYTCAQLLTTPRPGSPLSGLGLVRGDLLTHLNDVRLNCIEPMNCGFGEVSCCYIRLQEGVLRSGTIHIPQPLTLPSPTEIAPPPFQQSSQPQVLSGIETAPEPPQLPVSPPVAEPPVSEVPAPPADFAPVTAVPVSPDVLAQAAPVVE